MKFIEICISGILNVQRCIMGRPSGVSIEIQGNVRV